MTDQKEKIKLKELLFYNAVTRNLTLLALL